MKKFFKLFISIIISIIPIALIACFAVPFKKFPTIYAAGSSSLQSLVTEFGDEWKSETDLIVQGGGSGFGMKSIATNSKDIGLASKNTYSSVQKATMEKNGYNKETWEKNWIKTLTIGWDSISIVYKSKIPNVKMYLDINANGNNESSMSKLYKMFSGVSKYKVSDFISLPYESNEYFVPYGRTGGAKASGTATSFMYESTFDWNENEKKDSELVLAKDALETGNYLNNNVRTTSESNVETWNKVKNENMDNAIVYLSTSFVLQNYDDLQKNNFNVAYFNGENPTDYINNENGSDKKLDIEFLKRYKWFSPFNIMISLNNTREEVKDFVKWIYFDPQAKNVFNKQKIVHLDGNLKYFNSMLSDEYQMTSFSEEEFDNKLFDEKNSDINKGNQTPDIKYYGIPKEVVLSQK